MDKRQASLPASTFITPKREESCFIHSFFLFHSSLNKAKRIAPRLEQFIHIDDCHQVFRTGFTYKQKN